MSIKIRSMSYFSAIMSIFRLKLSPLTPHRLAKLANTTHLEDSWYYIAAAAFTICNRPEEVPKIFHMALSPDKTIQSAQKAIKQSEIVFQISSAGPPPASIEELFKTHSDEINTTFILKQSQIKVASNMREALLKGAALGGLPRSINALSLLRNATPMDLRGTEPIRASEGLTPEQEKQRGQKFWSNVYGKIDGRVKSHLRTAYPDLLDYALDHVYGPLLSYTGVLGAKDSSLVVVACLVPQDVNPQLKGHLRGAQNNGATLEEIRATRDMAIEISEWNGVCRKEPVVML